MRSGNELSGKAQLIHMEIRLWNFRCENASMTGYDLDDAMVDTFRINW